jgi:hypothetical protein
MTESIFATDSEDFPALPATESFVHRLAGLPLEYLVEPRVLLEKDGYVKGGRIEQTSPLSPANLANVKEVLTDRSNYGDRGMGARCFFPGFAFTFGSGPSQVEVLVCLECAWVVFYSAGAEQWLVPSESGQTKLRALYEQLAA